jgi:hypothetical protein
MVGVQMGKQHLHVAGICMPLQRAQHAPAEVENQRRSVRRSEQITRRGRIRTHYAAGAAEDGYSHGHYCAMPNTSLPKTSPHWCDQNLCASI